MMHASSMRSSPDRSARSLLSALSCPAIAEAAAVLAERIANGGRLIYAGAGTSIRIAVQDGSELPATFGMPEDKIAYLIAGGRNAMFDTLAEAEDDAVDGGCAGRNLPAGRRDGGRCRLGFDPLHDCSGKARAGEGGLRDRCRQQSGLTARRQMPISRSCSRRVPK